MRSTSEGECAGYKAQVCIDSVANPEDTLTADQWVELGLCSVSKVFSGL